MHSVLHTTPGAQGKYCIANFYPPSCLRIGMCSRRSLAGSFFPHTLCSIQAAAGQKCTLQFLCTISIPNKIFTTQVMRVFCHFSMHADAQRRENCQCVQGVAAHQAAQPTSHHQMLSSLPAAASAQCGNATARRQSPPNLLRGATSLLCCRGCRIMCPTTRPTTGKTQ